MSKLFTRKNLIIFGVIVGIIVLIAGAAALLFPKYVNSTMYSQLMDGRLTAADYWDDTPKILSAGLGFSGIIGMPTITEQTVKDAGGAWDANLTCANGQTPTDRQRTSAVTSDDINNLYKVSPGASIDHEDGLPIVFSWPVRSDTVDPSDFQFTLNTGRVVFPKAAGMVPNWELNERNVVVVFGHLGNRGIPGAAGYCCRTNIADPGWPIWGKIGSRYVLDNHS